MIMDVEGHRGLGLDAHHIAVFLGSRGVDKLDELFGLAGALFTHDKSDHKKSLLCITSVPRRYGILASSIAQNDRLCNAESKICNLFILHRRARR